MNHCCFMERKLRSGSTGHWSVNIGINLSAMKAAITCMMYFQLACAYFFCSHQIPWSQAEMEVICWSGIPPHRLWCVLPVLPCMRHKCINTLLLQISTTEVEILPGQCTFLHTDEPPTPSDLGLNLHQPCCSFFSQVANHKVLHCYTFPNLSDNPLM